MQLSIAINSYKNPDLLRLCINSIKEHVKGVEYEIIVADSQTGEVTKKMMSEEFPDIKFFPFNDNVGFQNLVKKGYAESTGDYVLFLNSDIVVTENSVEDLYNFVKSDESIGLAGPMLMNFNGTFQDSCFRFYQPITIIYRRSFLKNFEFAKKHLNWFLMKDSDHTKTMDVDWLMGSAFMVSRKSIEKVGPMDPRFFMYMEDVDWCRRFWENGLRVVYYPKSKMYHYHGKGSDKGSILRSLFNKLTWIHTDSAVKYFLKYRGKKNPRQ